MAKAAAIEFTGTDLLEHPAVQLWNQLQPPRIEPEAVQILKQKNKSAIYRIVGVGPERSAVIAKRCLAETAQVEQTIYEDVLPRLPISGLRYYGCVKDRDSRFLWLFLEDAGPELYSLSVPEHGALASRWLGLMHTAGQRTDGATGLPDRGPRHYLEHLRWARDTIQCNLGNPALTEEGVATLRCINTQCNFVESIWPQLERFCNEIPPTFVHGDFSEKNLRVRRTPDGLILLPFDWETAGWGPPVADLVKCPELLLYRTVVGAQWPALELADLERLKQVGIVFRSLAGLQWESLNLAFQSAVHSVPSLVSFQTRLANALRALDLV